MSSPRISFTYQSSAIADPWWLRLVQLGIEDDTATLADAADLIDTIYSIDPCTEDTITPEDPDTETTDSVAETDVRRVVCSYDDQANIDVQVHVIRSNPSASYKLALQGGQLKSVETINEIITQSITVKDADSTTLDFPVLGDFTVSWAGAVYGASGSISPPIKRNGNTLSFGTIVKAGAIITTYATEYDLVTITILGIDGEPGQCTMRGFYHGLVEELELETPEPADELGSCRVLWTVPSDPHQIECYRTVYVSRRCQCSPDELDFYTYEEVVSCPDSVIRCPGVLNECRHYLGTVVAHEYVECPGDMVEAVSSPAYYKKICCEDPSVELPQCKERITSWRGGLPIEGGAQRYYDLYGADLEIIPISPPGGICGTWTLKQEIMSNNCCDTIPPLTWDADNSIDILQANDDGYVYVLEGLGPFSWRIISTRGYVWFRDSGTGTLATDEATRWAALVSGDYPCGTYTIEVTDACGTTVSGELVSAYGRWVLRYNTADNSQRWDISDIPGIPFSAPESFGFESIYWGGAEAYSRGMYVVIASGDAKTKYLQPVGVDRMNAADLSVCFELSSCPVDPGSYGASFALPGIGPDTTYLGGACGQAITSTDFDCRSRIYNPDWAALVAAITCGPSSMSTLTTISGDFALSVHAQTVADETCPSGQRCNADIYVKTFLYPVEIYDWEC